MINLNKKYDRQLLQELLESFLPGDLQFLDTPTDIRIGPEFKRIKQGHVLAEVPSLDLTVFELHHSSQADPRIDTAKEAFRMMAESFKHRAIVALKNESTDQWRLSLMTIDLDIDNKGGAKQVYSNPRRYSYLLGPETKIVTPGKYLLNQGGVKTFEELQKRFALEVVNNEFYNQIAGFYDALVGSEDAIISKSVHEVISKLTKAEFIRKDNKGNHYKISPLIKYPGSSQDSYQFATRLIGRVVFCWFLREKQSTNGIPLIDKSILSYESATKDNYYHAILAPLFFEVLNRRKAERREIFCSGSFGKVPYLNGGLFTPHPDDHYKFDEITGSAKADEINIPKIWIEGFFELLEQYHFTVDENTSIDIDLSIDPEMLGRIFENLLARINPETGQSVRSSSGSFYTPRDVVEYMVDESLVQYLRNATGIDASKLRALTSYEAESDKSYSFEAEEKISIVNALNKVRILDPACGSGAFPIGILQKVVYVLQQLDPDSRIWFEAQVEKTSLEVRQLIELEFKHKNFDYIRKLGIIRQSIFGIDIQPIATEIARLRCFLTLIVDQRVNDDDDRGVYPLPNLDFKFVTANTLVPIPEQRHSKRIVQQDMFDSSQMDKIEKLKRLRNQYFNSHGIEKAEIKAEFRLVQNELWLDMHQSSSYGQQSLALSGWDPFSLKATEWYDNEWMFGIADGFDIVIANPPYGVSIKDDYRVRVQKALGKVPDFEIYYYFLKIGKQLLRDNGILTYIIPNTFLFNVFAAEYTKSINNEWGYKLIVDCTAFKLFDTATVHNAIVCFSNRAEEHEVVRYKQTSGCAAFKELVNRPTLEVEASNLLTMNQNWGLVFKLQPEVIKLVSKIKSSSTPLNNVFPAVSQGLIAYDKYQGQSEEIIKSRAYHYKEKLKDTFGEWLNGEDIRPYEVSWNGEEYIDYPSGIANPRDPKFFSGPRVLIREITNPKIFAGYTSTTMYHDPAIIVVLEGDKDILPLLAILNSKLATFYHFNASPKATKGAFPKILVKDVNEFPIPAWEKASILSPLVKKLLQLKASGDETEAEQLQQAIDKKVYELYDLSKEEIKIVEDNESAPLSISKELLPV